ncbi:Aldehyde dehydrogenase family protein [Parafrankia irregularis]|uniref:Aldehyde dehydrogenase family protein n=1 Tax=Parafrankia irregularis TaxID=795642 RepID=A0A0S4QPE9_9ACTN|nr:MULTISPECIES: aldehyde dehydrogenase family protein [Parafrankia]MBE3200594.1 aldehyde dehydrogenase family protein [Parafrankia sp. CH37]CUU56926.1 Aldehyde dehydrogenase family protein [Parafrankia irregularis]
MGAVPAGEPVYIDALGPTGPEPFRARERRPLTTLAGEPVGEISQVPALYVRRAISAMRAAPTTPAAQRFAALDKAADLFEGAAVAGLHPDDYAHLVSRASGVPLGVVRASIAWVADVLRTQRRTVELAMPRGVVADWRDPATTAGAAVWTRRGEVFAVHAAGNTPAVHGLWPEALALGYKVALRPSTREPFTAFRLVSALRDAGIPPATLTLLPTDHAVADVIIAEADQAIVYGGQDVVAKYEANPRVLTQGPGRSKILVTADVDWREKIDIIAGSVSHLGGTACTCATAVLVEGDPEPLARALADRLSLIPSLPPEHPDATLTVQPTDVSAGIDRYLHTVAGDARALLGGDTIVDELPSGGSVLRPAVHLVASSTAPQLGVELPFPCVWVGPWHERDGIAPLRDSLVLTAMTTREKLIEALLNEPSITNLYLGDNPTTWLRPGIPHDGYLGEFLMRTKAMIRSVPAAGSP